MNQSVSPPPTPTKRLPPSPCVGICTMNDDVGLCLGCGRNRDEITGWISIDDDSKVKIWKELPGRMAQLGATSFRLAPEPDQIAAFARDTLDERAGRWVMGSTGASASFDAKSVIDVTENDDWVTAHSSDGQIVRIKKHDRMRAFGLTLGDESKRMKAVALVIPRGRAKLEQSDTMAMLGPDQDAADATNQAATLFDLAVGRTYSRVLLRAPVKKISSVFQPLAGQPFASITGQLHLLLNQTDIVVETALGRIESDQSNAIELVASPSIEEGAADNSLTKNNLDRFENIKISQAFAIGAVFHAHDPAWLVGRLTP